MRRHSLNSRSVKCALCGGEKTVFVFRFLDGPVFQQKIYRRQKEALKAERAPLTLYGCRECGFLFNASYDAKTIAKFSSAFDNTQDLSPYFKSYVENLARKLFYLYRLADKKILEIGCGKGEFLERVFKLGAKNVCGFDPAYVSKGTPLDKHVKKRLFDRRRVSGKYDFVVLRHVFSYIPKPLEFVLDFKKNMAARGAVYIETPSLEWVLKNKSFFDFYYEYCGYFSKRSLVYALGAAGFGDLNWESGLRGQYWNVSAALGGEKTSYKKILAPDFSTVSKFINAKIVYYKKAVANIGGRFVLWGAGAKGIAFLNHLQIGKGACPYVIDINPNKTNAFVPITGQKIVSPDILKSFKPKNIFITNPVYEKEIRAAARARGYKGKFFVYGN